MVTFIYALEWILSGPFEHMAAGFWMLLATVASWLTGTLLFLYFPLTWKKRRISTNLLGMAGSLLCLVYYTCLRFLTDETIESTIDRTYHGFDVLLYSLAGILSLAALAAFLLCGRNLILRHAFSRRERLAVSLPFWMAVILSCGTSFVNLLSGQHYYACNIGLAELILALVLTFALGEGKKKSSPQIEVPEKNTKEGGKLS